MSKVIVIGGGAAGMMAAYAAGMCGHEVTLYEKTKKLEKRYTLPEKADVILRMPFRWMSF